MKHLNNKGFAVSTILYGILAIIILVLLLIFGIMKASKDMNEELVENLTDSINSCVQYEVKLEMCNFNNPLNCSTASKNLERCLAKKDKLKDLILENNNGGQSDTSIDFVNPYNGTNIDGLFYTSTNTENNKTTYYFRGNVSNNYVKFGKETKTIPSSCTYNGNEVLNRNGDLGMGGESTVTSEAQCLSTNVCYVNNKYLVGSTEEECTGIVFMGTWLEKATWIDETYITYDIYWKIVRINEDGSIRLVYYGTDINNSSSIGKSSYNNLSGDNAFVGYMHGTGTYVDSYKLYIPPYSWSSYASLLSSNYVKMSKTYSFDPSTGLYTLGTKANGNYTSEFYGYYTCMSSTETTCATMIKLIEASTSGSYNYIKGAEIHQASLSTNYEDAHANEINSDVKTFIDKWYENNLKNKYSDYIADSGFCNDRTVAKEANSWHTSDTALGHGQNTTYYAGYNRYTTHLPQFACPNEERDLFTTSTSSKGNKKLDYPIGMLTSDELAYAGVTYGWESNTYLYYTNYSHTMSPSNYDFNYGALVFSQEHHGEMYGDEVYSNYNIYPVINLKSNVRVTNVGSDGTIGNEYIIKIN